MGSCTDVTGCVNHQVAPWCLEISRSVCKRSLSCPSGSATERKHLASFPLHKLLDLTRTQLTESSYAHQDCSRDYWAGYCRYISSTSELARNTSIRVVSLQYRPCIRSPSGLTEVQRRNICISRVCTVYLRVSSSRAKYTEIRPKYAIIRVLRENPPKFERKPPATPPCTDCRTVPLGARIRTSVRLPPRTRQRDFARESSSEARLDDCRHR